MPTDLHAIMQAPFKAPIFDRSAFNCPWCNAYADQKWYDVYYRSPEGGSSTYLSEVKLCKCAHCDDFSLWLKEKMIYPDASVAPLPNSDLPEEIKNDYNEARSIISRSPRGACALLRLCIQKLCGSLGESGKDLNADIASLVTKGLNPKIQMSLDIVRVIGNEAVHPGQIDLRDQSSTAVQLCGLINIIAEAMITQPKEIESLYGSLPASKLDQITKRDAPKPSDAAS